MTTSRMTAKALAQLAYDELAIKRTTAKVAHAQDDLDLDLYLSCFTEQVQLEKAVMIEGWKGGEISARDLALKSFEHLSCYDAVHHMVFNHIIDIDGDSATCVADLNAVSVFVENDKPLSCTIGGRYFLRLKRLRNSWLICERSITQRYIHGDQSILGKATARGPVREFSRS